MHRLFFRIISQTAENVKKFEILEINFFILNAANGF